MKKSSVVKKVISTILGFVFLVIIIGAIFISTYIFSQPDKSGDSRQLILGSWYDKENSRRFYMTKTGSFKMTEVDDKGKDAHTICEGWFKIDEDNHRIKILINPKKYDTKYDLGTKLKYFMTISYKDLVCPDRENKQIKEELKKADCKFIVENSDLVYICTRENYGENALYSGKDQVNDSSSEEENESK